MPKFTNISDGPRGINTTAGILTVEAGATTEDVELGKGEEINEEWFEQAKGKPGRPAAAKDDDKGE